MNNYFSIAFQVTKHDIFTVSYGGSFPQDENAIYVTGIDILNYHKTDLIGFGALQDAVLPKGSPVRKFWGKWKKCHAKPITKKQYAELRKDIDKLKEVYNFHELFGDRQQRRISFCSLVVLSKMPLKKTKQTKGAAS